MADDRRLLVFAKAPVPGRVKTRLIETLGADGATDLYRALVTDVTRHAAGLPGIQALVYHDPVEPGEFLTQLGLPLRAQRGLDLGQRMHGAIVEQLARGATRVVIIGSDSPDLPAARIRDAFDALDDHDLALGPAVDGGYYLLAVRAAQVDSFEGMFSGIEWGSHEVLAQTLAAVQRQGLRTALLDPWYDVDRADDLRFLRTHLEFLLWSVGEDRCPATRRVLSNLDRLP